MNSWRNSGINKRFKQRMYRSGCPVYCCYCAEPVPYEKSTVEHVMPLWRGGKTSIDNLLIACGPCNNAKAKDDNVYWEGHGTHLCLLGNICVCHNQPRDSREKILQHFLGKHVILIAKDDIFHGQYGTVILPSEIPSEYVRDNELVIRLLVRDIIIVRPIRDLRVHRPSMRKFAGD
jgi:hypothetical protein